jgi:hypothetical protein
MLRLALWLSVGLSLAPFSPARSAPGVSPIVSLTTYAAGASAGHALSLRVNEGDLELYRATITYPGFSVRDFHMVGPVGSLVGSFELDFRNDGVVDRVLALTSVSETSAYVDILADGVFNADLEPAVTITANTVDLRLPAGVDANRATRVAPVGCTVRLILLPNVIVNPALGGDYPVNALVTSVDPDTDGPDDGVGAPPEASRASLSIRIDGPLLTRFASLRVHDLEVRRHRGNRDRITIAGRFVLGAGSDGLNRLTDDVTVSLGSFSQTIPPSAFLIEGWWREYKDRRNEPGVERMTLTHRGEFTIDIRGIPLIDLSRKQTFSLRIGNDLGTVLVSGSDPKTF